MMASPMQTTNESALPKISVNLPENTKHAAMITTEISATAASTRLADKVFGDILVGSAVTLFVAPFLTIVDKAIVQSASGRQTLLKSSLESIQGMARNPINYLKSPTFLFMWAAYASTYSTANSLKTIVEHREYAQATQQEEKRRKGAAAFPKATNENNAMYGKMTIFLGTTFVNSGTSLLKDRKYAQMFGSASVKTNIPRITYALWISRDFMVVGSSFILPDILSCRLAEEFGMDKNDALRISQLALPVATQFVAGPLHFLGIDFYNRNLLTKTWMEAFVDRTRSLAKGFVPLVSARIARIIPGYGVGGVLNTHFRDSWRENLIQREVKYMMKAEDQMQRNNASRLVALVRGNAQESSS
jgi:hypothetical protein